MFEKFSIENIKIQIKDFINSERAILFLCISIALVFWLVIQLSKSHEVLLKTTLNIHVPNGKTLANRPPASLQVKLISKGWNLLSSDYNKQLQELSLTVNHDKTYNYRQLEAIILSKLSKKIEVASIQPNSLSFKLDDFMQKKVPVKAITSVNVINQFQLSNKIQLLPDTIEVAGPASIVSNISFVKTKKISANNLKENFYGKVDLIPQTNKQVEYQTDAVNFIMTVEQFSEKELLVPITIENDTANAIRLIPQTAKVYCTLGLTKYDELKPSDILLYVDALDLDWHKDTLLPILLKSMPNYVSKLKMEPEYVDYVIVVGKENTKNEAD